MLDLLKQNESSFRPRHEMKFLIPASILESVRDYTACFCKPDPMSLGYPPQYSVTTLQLDSPDLSLNFAKERELKNRFKLRIRSYGEPEEDCPIFIEIKRKFENIVSKSRAKLDRKTYLGVLEDSFQNKTAPSFENPGDRDAYFEFIRLVQAIDAGPVLRIRYDRECWVGIEDKSVRITMDTRLAYQPASSLKVFDETAVWRRADVASVMKGAPASVILELKSGLQIPDWVIRMVRHFSLQRIGFCKYTEAVKLESTFGGCSPFAQSGFKSPFHSSSLG